MNNLWTDTGYVSINHVGEPLCGDRVEIIGNNASTLTLVLADGLGSGVKANILSTLTSKIICTMMANDMPIEDCVDTIVKTLPVCNVRQIAHSTFTIIRVTNNSVAELIQFDNPNVILLREGKEYNYPIVSRVIEGKTILESKIQLCLHDMFIAMSDGAIYAGVGKSMNFGWQRENIADFAQRIYEDKMSAKLMASAIVDECNRLY
ncbi:MAG: SpoIIE family protein phosphatase, partial [Ruthenibacterium sp.]